MIAAEYDHFNFLNPASLEIDTGKEKVRFIGGTLWSNFDTVRNVERAQSYVKRQIADFMRIHIDPVRLFNPQDCRYKNMEFREFLAQELTKDYDGKTVVVTHFLPSEKSISPQFLGSTVNSYFACNCEEFMSPKVPLWIHGHTHNSIDYVLNGTHVVANPRGYHTENKSYNGKLVVEI